MAFSVINFIHFNQGQNILKFLVDQFGAKKIMEAYPSLDDIWINWLKTSLLNFKGTCLHLWNGELLRGSHYRRAESVRILDDF